MILVSPAVAPPTHCSRRRLIIDCYCISFNFVISSRAINANLFPPVSTTHWQLWTKFDWLDYLRGLIFRWHYPPYAFNICQSRRTTIDPSATNPTARSHIFEHLGHRCDGRKKPMVRWPRVPFLKLTWHSCYLRSLSFLCPIPHTHLSFCHFTFPSIARAWYQSNSIHYLLIES